MGHDDCGQQAMQPDLHGDVWPEGLIPEGASVQVKAGGITAISTNGGKTWRLLQDETAAMQEAMGNAAALLPGAIFLTVEAAAHAPLFPQREWLLAFAPETVQGAAVASLTDDGRTKLDEMLADQEAWEALEAEQRQEWIATLRAALLDVLGVPADYVAEGTERRTLLDGVLEAAFDGTLGEEDDGDEEEEEEGDEEDEPSSGAQGGYGSLGEYMP